ncbi:DsbA family protein [Vibrio rumoiensis]|uniref:Thioredoxin n=1 Tax=Vibrio rumoiensis 1S-45 TaxID=1188252 RepID=A0A1E5E3G3_9VIBR|nr:DsbA family protein [Vibrio rumoiensis]OEF26839.1 thioredoxin [Vibrio rumoiensis 1S-45]
MKAKLYYIHDPMCSWCWGYKPTWEKLKAQLPERIDVEYLMGGLAPDNTEPMPSEMKAMLEQTWRRIEAQLGTSFNYDFWQQCQPVRTTYPACRAVIAAQLQGKGEAMITAIQEAYYLRAMEPHVTNTHVLLAKELGLDVEQFSQDIVGDEVQTEFSRQLSFCQMLGAHSFPSLVLSVEEQFYAVPISYTSAEKTLQAIQQQLN